MPGRRAGTKPQPTSMATPHRAGSRVPPRRGRDPASAPPSTRRAPSTACFSACGSSRSGRDVLEADAGLREVRHLADARPEVDRATSYADESTHVAPEQELLTAPAPSRRAPAGPRGRRGGARRCASAAPARRAPRAGPPRGRPTSGRRAGGAARSRSGRASRRRPRRRRRSRRTAARRPSTRGSSRPNSSSSRARSGVIPARSQSSSSSSSSSLAPTAARRRRRSFPAPASSSSRITRSGRNSSRCSRRIVSRRSTSSSEKSR